MLYLTDTAKARVQKWFDGEPDSPKNIRIALRKAGCTGLMYEVVFDKSFDPSVDFMSKLEGLNIIVELQYIGAIQGSTLDYVTEGMNSHFELVNNPNEKARCGCGESFTI